MIAWNKRIGAIGSSSLMPRRRNVLKSISGSVQTYTGVYGRWKRLKRLDAITKNVIYLKARRHERDFAFGEIKRTISKQNTRQANKTYSRRGQMDSPLLKMLPFARSCDSIYLNLPAKLASSGIAASSDAATSFRNQFPREIEYRRNGALSGQIDHCRPSGTTWPLLGNARTNIFLFIIHLWRGPNLDDL